MIGVVGLGKLGSSLNEALQATDRKVFSFDPAFPDARTPQELIDACDLVFLAIPDDAIEAFVRSRSWHDHSNVIHCSGALGLEVLEKARKDGACVGSFHPLQAFRGPSTSWNGVTVGILAEPALEKELCKLALELGAVPHRQRSEEKLPVHLAAAFLSNFTVTLFAVAKEMLSSSGYSSEEAHDALVPLLRGTIENIASESISTGPIARGDAGTVRLHLDCLKDFFPQNLELYQKLAEKTLFREKHELPASKFEAVLKILAQPSDQPPNRGEEIPCERC